MTPAGGAAPTLPLAPTQEMQWELMWALAPDDPGASRVLVVDNRRVEGPLDHGRLRAALASVTGRHDALRVSFASGGAAPAMVVAGEIEPPLEYLDVSGLPASRQRERVDELVFHENRRPFDLRSGPCWHLWLVRLGPEAHLLTLTLSHLVGDGRACRVFAEDLLDAYARCRSGAPAPGDPGPSLGSLVSAQARRFAPGDATLSYWRERLAPVERDLVWLPAAPGSADLLGRGGIAFDLEPATVEAIRRLAWRARTTPFVVLLAAYHLHLSVVTGKETTVIATGVDPRATGDERRAVMQFVTDPLVSVALPGSASLLYAVVSTHRAMLAAVDRMVPYTAMARAANPAFDDVRPWPADNLCDGHFFAGAPLEQERRAGELTTAQVYLSGREPPGFASDLVVGDLPQECLAAWEAWCLPSVAIGEARDGGMFIFNDRVCPRAWVQRLVDQYRWVARQVATAGETTVGDLRAACEERFDVRAGEARARA